MAVGLVQPEEILPVRGIRIGAVDAGIRRSPGEDLVIFEMSDGAAVAAVFTKNLARAAPVEVAVKHLQHQRAGTNGHTRALVVNSGNANAGVGEVGIDDCLWVCEQVARELGVTTESVLPFSTGVIGERLPLEQFGNAIGPCAESLGEDNWLAAARSIMTTDTVAKGISRVIETGDGGRVTISGIAKGSGMIEPNMATMLAFIATDAEISVDCLDRELKDAVDASFNRIIVDGDTSTNDACVLIAMGQSGVRIGADESDALLGDFRRNLREVAETLAQAIVRDGEGATKFVTITVSGGQSRADCDEVARTIANSALVKTALHASDPNWGRIYAAIGRARVDDLQMSAVSIRIGDVEVMTDGALSAGYSEQSATEVMRGEEFTIFVDLGVSQDQYNTATVWTGDLSAEYVRINAEYRS